MDDLLLRIPSTIHYGPDVIHRVGSGVAEFGNRALILTEPALQDARYVGKLRESLERRGISCIVYDDLAPGTGLEAVNETVELARSSKAQMVIGMGGMKVLTAARLTAAAAPRRVKLQDVLSGALAEGNAPSLTYVEIPSSCRNHFMLKDHLIVTDYETRTPRVVRLPHGLTRAIFIDPRLSLTLSPRYTGAVMMDSLLASIEGYLSPRGSFFSDAMLIDAITILVANVREACLKNGNERARMRATEAGMLTALGLSLSSQGVGGAITYALNARYNVPKSWIATVLLPHIVDNITASRPDKLKRLHSTLAAADEEAAEKFATVDTGVFRGGAVVGVREMTPVDLATDVSAGIRRLIGVLDLPARLRDFDLPLDEMAGVAETAAFLELSATSPVPFSAPELYDLIKQAF